MQHTGKEALHARRYMKGFMPGISGGWMLWFTLQSPLLMAEAALGRWAQRRQLHVHPAVRNSVCWVVLTGLASLTFCRQQRASGLRDDTNGELRRELQKLYGPMWEVMQGVVDSV